MHLFISFILTLLSLLASYRIGYAFEAPPQALVANMVDATSGAYLEKEEDFVLASIEKIPLFRHYSSAWGKWRFFPHCLLVRGEPRHLSQTTKSIALTFDSSGIPLRLVSKSTTPSHFQFALIAPLQNPLPLIAKANFADCSASLQDDYFEMTLPDGTVRTYRKVSSSKSDLGPLCHTPEMEQLKNKTFYHLISERLPSHNTLLYDYSSDGYLRSIELVDRKDHSHAKIYFQYKKDIVHVTCNDKKVVSYHFENGLLTRVARATKPSIIYTYANKLLIKKELSEGRYVSCSYTEQGKVHAIMSAVSATPLYRFQYQKDTTEVIDCNNNKTIFCFNDQLLKTIEFFEGTTLVRKDSFIWSEPDTANVQTILAYAVQDGKGKVIQSLCYEYQKNDALYTIHQDNCMPKGEKSRLSSHFSIKHPWQLCYQEDNHGNSVHYEYLASTSLLEKKLTKKAQKISAREFYDYDKTAKLICHISDDGSSEEVNDLACVTERYIQKNMRKRSHNEESCEEWIYDPITAKDYLIQRFQYTFDQDGNIIKRELYDTDDEKSKTEEFTFDALGNCTRSVNALGEVAAFQYDANNNCTQIKTPHLLTSFTYDQANRLITTKESYSDKSVIITRHIFDLLGHQIATIDRYGNQTDYTYDIFSRCTSIRYPEITREGGNAGRYRPKEIFSYDLVGNLLFTQDPNGNEERRLYNANGQLQTIHYPDNTLDHYLYHAHGPLKRVIHRDDTITNFSYDDKNNLQSLQVSALTPQKKIGDTLASSEFTYAKGQAIEEKKDDGTHVSRTYDVYGRLQSETTQSSKKEYTYDTLHRLSRITYLIDGEESLTECFKYDLLDRITARWIKEPDGSKTALTSYSYDAFENVTTTQSNEKITYIEGVRPHLIETPYGTTRIDYLEALNTLGQRHLQMCITNPQGVVTIIDYDALGRAIEETMKDPFGAILSHQKIGHDALGNCTSVEKTLLPKSETAHFGWTYNSMQNLEALRENGSTTRYGFSKGRLRSKVAPNGTFEYGYTATGNVQKIFKEKKEVASFIYDKANRVVTGSLDGKSHTKREYASHGKTTSETITDAWGSYQLHYAYDGLGRLKRITLPDNSSINYRYTGSTLHSIIRKTATGEKAYSHKYTKYNARGQPLEEQLINGEKRFRSYSPGGEPCALETKGFETSVTQHDALGNPTKIKQNKKSFSYVYDSLGRLIEEKGERKKSYSYDAMNNVLSCNENNFAYDNRNHLLQNSTQTYTYDAADNLRSISTSEQLSYNAFNQLISYQNGPSSVEYTWDIYGRRITRKEGDSIRRMFFIGNVEIGALNKEGEIIELKVPERIVGEDAQGSVAIELNHHTYVPFHDLLGNVIALCSSHSGRIVESYEYTAYGTEKIWDENGKRCTSSPLANPWRYRNLRVDPTTHFVCFGFRDYDPKTQRFLTRDPLGFVDDLNPYVFARNNPITYTDLYGLKVYSPFCTCCKPCSYYTTGACTHGGDLLLDDDTEQERQLSELENQSWNYFEHRMNDALDAWDTFSNVTILAGAGATPVCGAGIPILGYGIASKVGGRVAKVALPVFRKIAVSPVGRYCFRKVGNSWKYIKDNSATCLSYLKKWFKNTTGTQITTKETYLNGPACSVVNAIKLKNSLIAREIAAGHAFEKHVIIQGEFRGLIRTRGQFTKHIEHILNNPNKVKALKNNRTAFLYEETSTVVIRNPKAIDGGTAFQPLGSLEQYFYGLN